MDHELSVGTNLSHYRIVSKLGAGGMGEVWLAEDTRLERSYTVTLEAANAQSGETIARTPICPC